MPTNINSFVSGDIIVTIICRALRTVSDQVPHSLITQCTVAPLSLVSRVYSGLNSVELHGMLLTGGRVIEDTVGVLVQQQTCRTAAERHVCGLAPIRQ